MVAEIGFNHNGSFQRACELVESAKRAGADAVKFQVIRGDILYTPYSKSTGEGLSPAFDRSVIDFFDSFALSREEYRQLIGFCRERNIEFFASVFDPEDVAFLAECGVRLFKIASSDISYELLLERIAQTGLPVIVSCGMASHDEISRAVKILMSGTSQIALLHCVSQYPAAPEDMMLSKIELLRNDFGLAVGLSDHSKDAIIAQGAFFLNAFMLEKHFIDRYTASCPDMVVSVDENDFTALVALRDRVFSLRGRASYALNDEQKRIAELSRRSLFSAHDLKAGSVLTFDDIICRRPGNGVGAARLREFLSCRLLRDIPCGEPIFERDIEKESQDALC